MKPLNIFIGYDSRYPVAYHVCAHSIISRASVPVRITPLVQDTLRKAGLYWREKNPLESTEFSFTRFLVPHLCGYEGHAVFMDSDMLCLTDIAEILDFTGFPGDVRCCQHEYTPREGVKFLGEKQTAYPRKNWSSFMLFNCDRCLPLIPEFVNTAGGLELHRFLWSDAVGSLDLAWNWLVGEYAPNPNAKILHYTNGGPFNGVTDCDHADLWLAERNAMLASA